MTLDTLWEVLGWVAAILNVVGNLMLTTKGTRGWIVRLVCNLTWMPYGVYTKAWALCANHMLFVGINAYGWWKWHRDEKRELGIVTPGETVTPTLLQKARRLAYQDGFNDGRKAERKSRSY